MTAHGNAVGGTQHVPTAVVSRCARVGLGCVGQLCRRQSIMVNELCRILRAGDRTHIRHTALCCAD
jgi:hypothetical protein